MEGESRKVGKVFIPEAFADAMKKGKKIADGIGGNSLQRIIHQLDTTTFFIKESIKDLYDQKESVRLLINSSQETINRMNKTLQGVNNNPLIRSGIADKKTLNKVEIDD